MATTRRVYGLREGHNRTQGRDYSYRYGHREHSMALIHTALTQMSMKAGIWKFKEIGKDVVKKEFLQLHDRKAFGPMKEK